MSRFVLIGGPFAIADHPEFSGQAHENRVFGDVLEMPDELANRAISEGAAMLPEDQFQKLGFTAAEVSKFPNARVQGNAPADWKAKHLAARIALHDYRAKLSAPATPAAPAAPKAQPAAPRPPAIDPSAKPAQEEVK